MTMEEPPDDNSTNRSAGIRLDANEWGSSRGRAAYAADVLSSTFAIALRWCRLRVGAAQG
jgi:hypothetical protein